MEQADRRLSRVLNFLANISVNHIFLKNLSTTHTPGIMYYRELRNWLIVILSGVNTPEESLSPFVVVWCKGSFPAAAGQDDKIFPFLISKYFLFYF